MGAAPEPGGRAALVNHHPGRTGRLPASTRHALAAALGAVFIGALDLTVIATILPRMIGDLNVNTADIDRYIWVVNGYLLAYVVAIPLVGRLSDLIGRTLAFQVALGVFLVGSVWCALATSLSGLIIGRAIQGAGGGALLPVTMALVGDLLPPARRVAALGLVGAVDTLGWVLGPLWGAAVVGLLGGVHEPWRWVFYVNLPLGLAAAAGIALTGRGLPRRAPGVRGHLDLLGAALLAGALVLLNLGLSSGGEFGGAGGEGLRALGGTPNPFAKYLAQLLLAALLLGVAFLHWERRVRVPVLPLGLFRRRRFSAAITANFLAGASLIVAMVDTPVVVALLVPENQVSTKSALMLAPFTLLMAALSFFGGRLVGRLGERNTAGLGLVLVAVGYAALWYGLRNEELVGMVAGLAQAGGGFGLVIAPIGASVIDAAPAADRGIAAGLTLVFRLLGMTIGISSLTAAGVKRLQVLTQRLHPPVPYPAGPVTPAEGTAHFFLRQQQFIEEHGIPTTIQVIRETFLVAAVLALLALIPVALLRSRTGRPNEGMVPL